jgi:outer membrane lipoprotein carrier protein
MRWEYQVPEQQFLVSNGETLWIYTPSLRQVIENRFSAAYDSKTPALFLAGLGNIKKDFEIRFNPENPGASEESYVLELKPKDSQLYLSKLVLTVNRKSYLVEKSTAYDPLGNIITLRFSNIRTNIGLDASTFQIQVPDGVERIRPPTFPANP